MKIFNHVQIKVKDLEVSRKFYDSIMGVLGYKVVLEIKDEVIGYGTYVHDMFEIRQATKKFLLSQDVHVAFNASDAKSVDLFFQVALENGGQHRSRPRLRPEYEEGYYAAYVSDPDGNNIEAIFSNKRCV